MAKLFPPYIPGVLPAFVVGSKISIKIPFTMNRGVTPSQLFDEKKFDIKIKSLSSNTYFNLSGEDVSVDFNDSIITYRFNNNEKLIKIGNFYKIQVAYIDVKKVIGQYSTVGIIKATSMPVVAISGLEENTSNNVLHSYIGTYKQEDDVSEHVYSYCFNLYDSSCVIVETSGELLHNSSNDINAYSSYDEYKFQRTIEENKRYYVEYKITTINGLEVSSPKYEIAAETSAPSNLSTAGIKLKAENNFDNGFVSLKLTTDKEDFKDIPAVSGTYLVSRAEKNEAETDKDKQFLDWKDLFSFQYSNTKLFETTNTIELENKDFTIEQGKVYKYAIQEYNENNFYTERLASNEVYADFEDCFLYDGKRQLKIRYNPKISNFKTTILEQKIDTIGSKYPFFFRNGRVSYKEFPISGLISLLMDENNYFNSLYENDNEYRRPSENGLVLSINNYLKSKNRSIHEKRKTISTGKEDNDSSNPGETDTNNTQEETNNQETNNTEPIEESSASSNTQQENDNTKQEETTRATANNTINNNKRDLSSENIYKERLFKLDVLDWLNNGENKIFKSPTEGNYIVRLMNVNLTPLDQLGRMLHNFSCQAYESEEYSYENLVKNKIVEIKYQAHTYLAGKTVYIKDIPTIIEDNEEAQVIQASEILGLMIDDGQPGDQFEITFSNGSTEIIYLGLKGSFRLPLDIIIKKIKVIEVVNPSITTITYFTQEEIKSDLDSIKSVSVAEIPCREFRNIITIDDIETINGNPVSKFYYPYVPDYKQRIYLTIENFINTGIEKNDVNSIISNYMDYLSKEDKEKIKKYLTFSLEKTEEEINQEKVITPTPSNYHYINPKFKSLYIYYLYAEKDENYKEFKNENFALPNNPNSDEQEERRQGIEERRKTFYQIYLKKNGEENIFSVANGNYLFLDNVGEIDSLKIGPGVILRVGYKLITQNYIFEDYDENIKNCYNNYQNEKTEDAYKKYIYSLYAYQCLNLNPSNYYTKFVDKMGVIYDF